MRRLEALWVAATYLGDGYVWGLLGVYLMVFGGRVDRLNVLVGLGVLMVEITAFRAFKGLFARPRPPLAGRSPRKWYVDTFAFPSGHTTAAFGMAYLVTQLYPHPVTLAVVYLLACAIGISRVYLRDHYLIDVIAGAVLGTVMAFIVFPVFSQIIYSARW
ncbi:MAG: phosphatase PAP2 family protein [Candidatus Bipolaricaulota bacterium]